MNKRIKIIVVTTGLLLLWASFDIKIVKGGGKGRIVSREIVKIDSLVKQIEYVTPDEVQRLEGERDRDVDRIEEEIRHLKVRVLKLEGGG